MTRELLFCTKMVVLAVFLLLQIYGYLKFHR
jgi:hypothetical protein